MEKEKKLDDIDDTDVVSNRTTQGLWVDTPIVQIKFGVVEQNIDFSNPLKQLMEYLPQCIKSFDVPRRNIMMASYTLIGADNCDQFNFCKLFSKKTDKEKPVAFLSGTFTNSDIHISEFIGIWEAAQSIGVSVCILFKDSKNDSKSTTKVDFEKSIREHTGNCDVIIIKVADLLSLYQNELIRDVVTVLSGCTVELLQPPKESFENVWEKQKLRIDKFIKDPDNEEKHWNDSERLFGWYLVNHTSSPLTRPNHLRRDIFPYGVCFSLVSDRDTCTDCLNFYSELLQKLPKKCSFSSETSMIGMFVGSLRPYTVEQNSRHDYKSDCMRSPRVTESTFLHKIDLANLKL